MFGGQGLGRFEDLTACRRTAKMQPRDTCVAAAREIVARMGIENLNLRDVARQRLDARAVKNELIQ